MRLFHSSTSAHLVLSPLTHTGSFEAAAHRIEDQFLSQSPRQYDGKKRELHVLDYFKRHLRTETTDDFLEAFIQFAKERVISEYRVGLKKPLKLFDCWMDDPIGSGGLKIFAGNDQLTSQQKLELFTLFYPFLGVIYPDEIMTRFSLKKIRDLIKANENNKIFRDELEKRRSRSSALGEDFNIAVNYEAVWVDLTVKLRKWCLKNGFDSFEYQSNGEGNDETCFVPLRTTSPKDKIGEYKFDEAKYRELVFPVFEDLIESDVAAGKNFSSSILYAREKAADFWQPV
jgi:hypothetical protein